jgi:hypothetical protein
MFISTFRKDICLFDALSRFACLNIISLFDFFFLLQKLFSLTRRTRCGRDSRKIIEIGHALVYIKERKKKKTFNSEQDRFLMAKHKRLTGTFTFNNANETRRRKTFFFSMQQTCN